MVTVTSNGLLHPTPPLADDEHRDFEIHQHGRFDAIAVQLKTATVLVSRGKSRAFRLHFSLKGEVLTSPRFWYCLAHFDIDAMRFTDPLILAPSTFVHRRARSGTVYGRPAFHVWVNLEADAKDMWVPFRVQQAALGGGIEQILRKLPRRRSGFRFEQTSGLSIIRLGNGWSGQQLRRAA